MNTTFQIEIGCNPPLRGGGRRATELGGGDEIPTFDSMKRYLIIASGVLSFIYLIYPSLGLFELIPDAIPVVGHLDEATAVYVIISVIAYLRGKDFGLFSSSQENEKELLDKQNPQNKG